jgi:hypothetical protein
MDNRKEASTELQQPRKGYNSSNLKPPASKGHPVLAGKKVIEDLRRACQYRRHSSLAAAPEHRIEESRTDVYYPNRLRGKLPQTRRRSVHSFVRGPFEVPDVNLSKHTSSAIRLKGFTDQSWDRPNRTKAVH